MIQQAPTSPFTKQRETIKSLIVSPPFLCMIYVLLQFSNEWYLENYLLSVLSKGREDEIIGCFSEHDSSMRHSRC